jgi:hypothetical protein
LIGRKFGGSYGKIRLSTNFKLYLWLHSKAWDVKGMWNKCEKSVKSYFLKETVKQHPFGWLSLTETDHCSF